MVWFASASCGDLLLLAERYGVAKPHACAAWRLRCGVPRRRSTGCLCLLLCLPAQPVPFTPLAPAHCSWFASSGLCPDRCGIDLHWWTDLGVPSNLASVVGCHHRPVSRALYLSRPRGAYRTAYDPAVCFAAHGQRGWQRTGLASDQAKHAKLITGFSERWEPSHNVWVVRSIFILIGVKQPLEVLSDRRGI